MAQTDLLVMDVRGLTGPLSEELWRHEERVGRFIALIGTPGLAQEADQAIEEFLRRGAFRLRRQVDEGAGLTVLERG